MTPPFLSVLSPLNTSSYIRGFRTSSKLSVSKTKSSPKETHLFDYTTSQFRMIRFTITVVTKKCPT
ncbi:hypothetical protein C4Q31_13965 [Leptospira borgpetersenii serovar Ceylonica]|nr:hypothetical protein C4Q31_13965 [Leptospira borgpetersenii serovar Ceylonica]